MEEIWKDVVGYEGLYQVSNLGNLRSLDRIIKDKKGNRARLFKGKYLALTIGKNGYRVAYLSRNQFGKIYYVHRIVASAFIPNPDGRDEIDHINGDRSDNRIENLRWCTHKENMNNPIFIERQKESQPRLYGEKNHNWGRKASKEKLQKMSIGMTLSYGLPILQYSKDGVFIKEWLGGAIAARELGLNKNHIYECCKGKVKTSGGFVWKYANKKD